MVHADLSIDQVDRDLCFALEIEHGIQRSEVANYDDVKSAIVERLEMLRDTPERDEAPTIYHLDVAAMYPNIILTNRLQPTAIVGRSVCSACDFNRADNSNRCKRSLEWQWRGELYAMKRPEFYNVLSTIQREEVPVSKAAAQRVSRLRAFCILFCLPMP